MKRVARTRSGTQIYGQKWQNTESSNESESDDGSHSDSASNTEAGNTIPIPISGVAAAPPIPGQLKGRQDNENQTWRGNRTGSFLDRQSAMYKAALEGDWLAAEMLLGRDPTLLCDEITERGDRALHVAAATKHMEFIEKLVGRMSPDDIVLHDGYGYTACCYAALSGDVRIAEVMMKKNQNLAIARDRNNMTPLHKAALRGDKKMVSYLVESTKFVDLPEEEWFDLLLVTVRRKMHAVALEILKKDGSLATMKNEEGTALHVLARQDTWDVSPGWKLALCEVLFGIAAPSAVLLREGTMPPTSRLLAKKLWDEINQRLQRASVLELMKNPLILHDAAKVGNVELITMLTHIYPDLIWDTDSNGYTMFHIAVIYRQDKVLGLIHQIGSMKDFIAISQDENGNNILHLAAALAPPTTKRMVSISALQMQRDLKWFKEVEAIAPSSCLEMINKDRLTPRELFSAQHKSLLRDSKTWMTNTADSCMLISTLVFTVVFAAMFTAPGGNNSETGSPILLKNLWFRCFILFELLALLSSIFSIIMFWSIMTSSFAEEKFLHVLPLQFGFGLSGMLFSLYAAISAFMTAYILIKIKQKDWSGIATSTLFYFLLLEVVVAKVVYVWDTVHRIIANFFWTCFRSRKYGLFSQRHATGKK